MESIRLIKTDYLENGLLIEVHEMNNGKFYKFGYYQGKLEFSYEIKIGD